jgi:hypothetical protein
MNDFNLFLQGLAIPGEAFALAQVLFWAIIVISIVGSPLWIILGIINWLFK